VGEVASAAAGEGIQKEHFHSEQIMKAKRKFFRWGDEIRIELNESQVCGRAAEPSIDSRKFR
jgi:hypothetical protein